MNKNSRGKATEAMEASGGGGGVCVEGTGRKCVATAHWDQHVGEGLGPRGQQVSVETFWRRTHTLMLMLIIWPYDAKKRP